MLVRCVLLSRPGMSAPDMTPAAASLGNVRPTRDLSYSPAMLSQQPPCSWHVLQAVKKEVDDAVNTAKQDAIPPADALWQNIWKDPVGCSVKGLDSRTHIKL